jgi:membrane fusion protein (multidrug efflux system)
MADAYPEETFSGQVVYVAPLVNERTRTVRVKAEVSNESGRLKPGMFGALTLVLEQRENALVIPEACIQFKGGATSIVVVNHEGLSEFRSVQIGNRFKGRVEIVDGVSEGEIVVVEGFQKMGPGTQVIAAPESAEYGVPPGPLGEASESSPSTASKAEGEGLAPL